MEAMRRKLVWVETLNFHGRACSECAWVFNPLGPPVGESIDEMKMRATKTRCSVLLADHSDLMLRMIGRLLQEQPGIEILGHAKNFAQALQMTAALKPQVVVMGLHMPDETEFEPDFIRSQLLSSTKHIIIISVWNDEKSQALANSYGAASFLDKNNLSSTLIPAIFEALLAWRELDRACKKHESA
jgi:DNA-binding NarL/FixJ family response regulator